MAADVYISVSSQADAENANLARERSELADDPERQQDELANLYVERGVVPSWARRVAVQLIDRDALGISEATSAKPVQAAMASAASFTGGRPGPLMLVLRSPVCLIIPLVAGGSLSLLAVLGMFGARAGGASLLRPTIRVMFWGALAVVIMTGIGALIGTAV